MLKVNTQILCCRRILINNLKEDGVLLKQSSSSFTLFVSTTRINFLTQLPIVFTVARNSGNMIMKFICSLMK